MLRPRGRESTPTQIGRVNPTLPDSVDFIIRVRRLCSGLFYSAAPNSLDYIIRKRTTDYRFYYLEPRTTMDFIIDGDE